MSSQQTPFSYFGHTTGVEEKNIWSSKLLDHNKCIGSGILNNSHIIKYNSNDRFIYKSKDMVNSMMPSGAWSIEIVDDQHIIFSKAQEIFDIRPGKKLNIILCSVLFMNIFYNNVLSYLLMFVFWSSMLCIYDNTKIGNNINSWSSLIPQIIKLYII